jgi:uncharacterized DUF497 family protein
MKISYDRQKDLDNQQKHGISLADAQFLDWESLLTYADSRRDYGEQRMIGYTIFGNRLYCVVYVDRGDHRRIISLRKANNREVRFYAANN